MPGDSRAARISVTCIGAHIDVEIVAYDFGVDLRR